MSDSFLTTWTVAHQAPLSMGLSSQEYWSGLYFLYIYISPMDYYSAIRKSEKMNVATYPFVATWKDLEVILREVS